MCRVTDHRLVGLSWITKARAFTLNVIMLTCYLIRLRIDGKWDVPFSAVMDLSLRI